MNMITTHGATLPMVGFGTGSLSGTDCTRAVVAALEAGYRHIDTAAAYGNEAAVGSALQASGLSRDEVIVTTKVWPGHFEETAMLRIVEASVKALGVDAVDHVLIHWADPHVPLGATMRALNAVAQRGLTRHVGVSNFPAALLEQAWRESERPIITNQCEMHPGLNQSRLLEACRRLDTVLVAYMPLGRRTALESPTLHGIAARLEKTPAQVALRWLLQQGVASIPKSTDPGRMRENLAIVDFHLSDQDMRAIAELAHPDGRMVPIPRLRRADGTLEAFPDLAPAWDD